MCVKDEPVVRTLVSTRVLDQIPATTSSASTRPLQNLKSQNSLLVIVLRIVPNGSRFNLSSNLLPNRIIVRFLYFFSNFSSDESLFVGGGEDCGTVLSSSIMTLLVDLTGVVGAVKEFDLRNHEIVSSNSALLCLEVEDEEGRRRLTSSA